MQFCLHFRLDLIGEGFIDFYLDSGEDTFENTEKKSTFPPNLDRWKGGFPLSILKIISTFYTETEK